MKPFNLKEALAGKPVITRDGKKIVEIKCFNTNIRYPVVAVFENTRNSSTSFMNDGKYVSGKESPYDLFMALEKVEKWVNIYKPLTHKGEKGFHTGYRMFDTKEDAIIALENNYYIDTIMITFEV